MSGRGDGSEEGEGREVDSTVGEEEDARRRDKGEEEEEGRLAEDGTFVLDRGEDGGG